MAAVLGVTMTSTAFAATAKLTAAQIVDKNTAARGGATAWRSVQSLSLIGKMDLGVPTAPTPKAIELAHRGSPTLRKSLADAGLRQGIAVAGTSAGAVQPAPQASQPVVLPFTLQMKRPHKTRLELVYNQSTAIQTFDGTAGWKYRPYLGQKTPVPLNPAELNAAASQPDLDGMLIDHAAKGNRIDFEKIEALGGRDQYRLRVTLKNGEIRRVWVDAQTFLETRVDNKPKRVEGRMRPASTYYSDYRAVDKLMIPHIVETRMEGVANSGKMLIDSVQVNPPIDDGRFARPL